MQTSTLTAKGQVTIPASVRKALGIRQGDRVGFIMEGDRVVLLPVVRDISAAFGIARAEHSISMKDMKHAIRNRSTA